MPAEISDSAAGPSRFPATSVVLFLLCLMYAINYIVRVDVSTAASVFQPDLHLSNTQVGLIFSAFAYSYLIFQIIGGWVSDRLGARLTLTIFAVIWSAATVCMGLAHGLTGMLVGRVVLGLGVSSLPTATRALAVWMPAGKRAFAQGITHSSARLGNALTPPLVAWLITLVSWRGAFVVLGIISFGWAIAWAVYYRDDPKDHPRITAQELETLAVGATQKAKSGCPVPWVPLICRMLPVTIVYFCYGWTLWFFLAWIPQFFLHSYKLKLNSSSLFAAGVFLGGVGGDLLGGIVSDRIFEKTGDRKKARRNLVIFGFLCSLVLMLLPILFFSQACSSGHLPERSLLFLRVHRRAHVGDSDGYRSAIFRERERSHEHRDPGASAGIILAAGCRIYHRQNWQLGTALRRQHWPAIRRRYLGILDETPRGNRHSG